MEKILDEVREICRRCELPGSGGRILREGNFLPLEQDEKSRELLEAYRRSAARLGFQVGGNAHRDDEWCRIDTLVPRAQALALTILEVAAA